MTTTEVAVALVALCQKGEFTKATETLYSKDVVSVEAMAMPPMPAEIKGIDAVMAKGKWWMDNHEVHGAKVEGPYLHGEQFIVKFEMDVTVKPTGIRMQMTETALYTVAGGKVVKEEFFYLAPPKK